MAIPQLHTGNWSAWKTNRANRPRKPFDRPRNAIANGPSQRGGAWPLTNANPINEEFQVRIANCSSVCNNWSLSLDGFSITLVSWAFRAISQMPKAYNSGQAGCSGRLIERLTLIPLLETSVKRPIRLVSNYNTRKTSLKALRNSISPIYLLI